MRAVRATGLEILHVRHSFQVRDERVSDQVFTGAITISEVLESVRADLETIGATKWNA